MSQTVIFSVGIVVFALTIWGAVMAGGIWLGQVDDANHQRGSDESDGEPRTTFP